MRIRIRIIVVLFTVILSLSACQPKDPANPDGDENQPSDRATASMKVSFERIDSQYCLKAWRTNDDDSTSVSANVEYKYKKSSESEYKFKSTTITISKGDMRSTKCLGIYKPFDVGVTGSFSVVSYKQVIRITGFNNRKEKAVYEKI